MGLRKEAIDELQAIYREEYGDNLSDEEAQEMGARLLALFAIIARPLPSENIADEPK